MHLLIFLQFMTQSTFKVKKNESHTVFRMEEYIVYEISAFKSQFCNVFVH